jgi:hypothetical protein
VTVPDVALGMDLEQSRDHGFTPRLRHPRCASSPQEIVRLLEHVAADQPLVHLFLVLAAILMKTPNPRYERGGVLSSYPSSPRPGRGFTPRR